MKYILVQKPVQFWRILVDPVWTDTLYTEKKKETRETPVAEAGNPIGHQLPMQRGVNNPGYTNKYLRSVEGRGKKRKPPKKETRENSIEWSLRSNGPALDPCSLSHRGRVGPRLGFPSSSAPVDGLFGKEFNLAHQEALLIRELVVIRPVFQEFGQESQKSVSIVDENSLHRHRFVRVGDEYLLRSAHSPPWIVDRRSQMIDSRSASLTYLKNVEPFILHHLAIIAQQLHT